MALPSSYLLMVASFSVTCTYQRLVNHRVFAGHSPTGHEGFPLLLCHMVLLIAWSWTAGYVVGSVSRRTLWASVVLAAVPFFAFPVHVGLLVVLLSVPAARDLWRLAGMARLPDLIPRSFVLALTMTVLMISAWSNQALWTLTGHWLVPRGT